MTSRTQRALILVDAGVMPAKAAKEVGINTATLYKALTKRKKRAERIRCPTCGSVLPEIKPLTED